MNPLEINVHVEVGMSSELTQLLSSFLGNTPKKKEVKRPREKKEDTPVVEEPTEEITEQAIEEEPVTAATEQEEPAEAPHEQSEKKDYTEEDVRAAMARTRERIEGEDYKLKTDSEGYKKWHRRLTAWFKNTASTYGAEKPSLLEDSEKRRCFIDDCDRVQVDGDELRIPIPF